MCDPIKKFFMPELFQISTPSFRYSGWSILPFISFLLCSALCHGQPQTEDLDTAVKRLEQRYEAVDTVRGDYRQTYRGPGIEQVESGKFWLKKPGLMRLECHEPEEKLFVADGRESFHYVPLDHQVYVQPLTTSELRNSPLGLLLGSEDIHKKYIFSWEEDIKPKFDNTLLIRLNSRQTDPGYSFVVLEIDRKDSMLKRILIGEESGNTSEYVFTDVAVNTRIKSDRFRFKVPKGIRIIEMTEE